MADVRPIHEQFTVIEIAMSTQYFGNSEQETEQRVFGWLDSAPGVHRVPQDALIDRVRHMITGQIIRPDGLLIFPNDEHFRCLRNRVFALEIKPDVIIRDHLKVISELTEQARSYIDSHYDTPDVLQRHDVDGCIIYPNIEQILSQMPAGAPGARFSRNDDYKAGVRDMHRRVLSRQRIYELVPNQWGFEILCADERLCRFAGGWTVSGKNHQFRRKVGSDYR